MAEHVEHNGVESPGKPFTLIFFIEMWERFGYYGMVALIVVFMIDHLGFSDSVALNTYGAFSALVYAFLSIGGYIGDKWLGTKRTTLLGAIVLCLGYALLSYHPDETLYYGLGAIIAGNMLFKANPSSLVSKLYRKDDPKLDSAFTMYYMSINLGSFISMTICPIVQVKYGYASAFLICAIGLLMAIIGYNFFGKVLSNIGSEPDFRPVNKKYLLGTIILVIVMVFLSAWLLKHLEITSIILTLALIVTFGFMVKFIITSETKEQRYKYVVCLVLIIEAIAFFILYQQMQTSLNLFTIRNTDSLMLGIKVPGTMFQNLNPFWIMVGSPILAILYNKLGKSGGDFSVATKFAFGMFLCSLGFLILPLGATYFAHNNIISGNWVIGTYFFQSIGELLVSGLGLSMVTKLVPQRIVGFVMGTWFMASAVAMRLGGWIASFASIPKGEIGDTATSLKLYSNLFLQIGVASLIICIIMFIFVPKLKKYLK